MKHEAVSTMCDCFLELCGLSHILIGLSKRPRVKAAPSRQEQHCSDNLGGKRVRSRDITQYLLTASGRKDP